MAELRSRNFASIIYPDSSPPDFIDRIGDLHLKAFLSPLHDRDDKKPHFHLLLMYDGKKSSDQVKVDLDFVGGVGCEIVKSSKGYARYLCHLDDIDKAQYCVDDVKCFGGLDYKSFIKDSTDKVSTLMEIMDFCDKYDVYSFYALCNYCRKYRSDWFSFLSGSSVFIREWLKSREWSKESGRGQIIDPETGEILS
mgnify:CR=1 FL=1